MWSRGYRDHCRSLASFGRADRPSASVCNFASDDRSGRAATRRAARTAGAHEAERLLHRGRGLARHRLSAAAKIYGDAEPERGLAVRPRRRCEGRCHRHGCDSTSPVAASDPWRRLRDGRWRRSVGLRRPRHPGGVDDRGGSGERGGTAAVGTAQAGHHSHDRNAAAATDGDPFTGTAADRDRDSGSTSRGRSSAGRTGARTGAAAGSWSTAAGRGPR
ncbi:Uncharacterised protein [Mycobacterium tuberculosis]|nr:Uncharacterised protein [Mycobacterium tuberculosis]